jgi:outer membrane protein assembly factor BamA
MRALGLWYHLDLQRPYWNPEKGFRFDATYELGFRAFGAGESFHRAWSQYSVVRRLPDGMGYLSETRLVGRLGGGLGSPDSGQHFRFGGPLAFRGQRSEDTEGSAYWLASVDWRFPVLSDLDFPVYDNVVNLRSLYGSIFYDLGESYLFGDSQGVDHALGVGLYFRLMLLSFVEQLTLRVEYGRSLRYDSDIAWFGLYHAF